MMKLFASNFDSCMPLSRLAALFEEYGRITALYIRQGEKRTYAIVHMPNDSDAEEAIRALDGKSWDGQRLDVKESKW